MSRHNKVLGDFFAHPVMIGDTIDIRTWMPRRSELRNYVVVAKPDGTAYEGLIIRKVRGFGGTTATMYIPWETLTYLEITGVEKS